MQELNSENKNIDQQELDKFAKMAASWWDLNGDFKPIHQLNPLRLNYILQHSNGLNGKKCWMSVVVAVFCLKVWQNPAQM